MERRWPENVSGLDEIVRYGLVPFGKMMGPWLLVRSSLAVGGQIAGHDRLVHARAHEVQRARREEDAAEKGTGHPNQPKGDSPL